MTGQVSKDRFSECNSGSMLIRPIRYARIFLTASFSCPAGLAQVQH